MNFNEPQSHTQWPFVCDRQKGEVLVCKAWQSENSLYYGETKGEETVAVREVKCGSHKKDVGSDSPNGTTDTPENH